MGVPGLAKTLLVTTIAKVVGISSLRIQFTPDLMPSDITGTEIIQEDPDTGRKQFVFVPGPVFANMVLADEMEVLRRTTTNYRDEPNSVLAAESILKYQQVVRDVLARDDLYDYLVRTRSGIRRLPRLPPQSY